MYQMDSDSKNGNFQNDVSQLSTRSSTTTDSESEEESDPWTPLIEEAKQRSNTAFEEM